MMDRLDRVMVTGAATAEAITPNDEADSFPSSQINRNTKIVDAATTNIIVQAGDDGEVVCGDLSPPNIWAHKAFVPEQGLEPSWHEDDKASREVAAAAAALS